MTRKSSYFATLNLFFGRMIVILGFGFKLKIKDEQDIQVIIQLTLFNTYYHTMI